MTSEVLYNLQYWSGYFFKMEYFNKILNTAKRKRRDYEVLDDTGTYNDVEHG